MPTTQASTTDFLPAPPTWNGRTILTDTAYLPYSHCAWLDGEEHGLIAYGHSEEQAIERLIEQLEDAARPRCPECDSANVAIATYEFGTDRETGYDDSGEAIRCLDCGALEPHEPATAMVHSEPVALAVRRSPEVAA